MMENNKIYTLNNPKLIELVEWAISDYIDDITKIENDTMWNIQTIQSTNLEDKEKYDCVIDLNGEEHYIQHIQLMNVYNDLQLKREEIAHKMNILNDILKGPTRYKNEWIQEDLPTTCD